MLIRSSTGCDMWSIREALLNTSLIRFMKERSNNFQDPINCGKNLIHFQVSAKVLTKYPFQVQLP